MNLFLSFTGLTFCLYATVFLWVGFRNYRKVYAQEIKRLPKSSTISAEERQGLKFSILIPFRNEAENLSDLFQSIDKLNFNKERFEVIFIDDHSQDNGVEILESLRQNTRFSSQIIQLNKPEIYGKKQALTSGIEQANHPMIITLDADSIVPSDWLSSIEQSIGKTAADFLAGPVLLSAHKGLLYQLQASEFMALQSLTQASYSVRPLLSNGTNLTYSKRVFNAVSGYSGNLQISSGDDMFLMRKIWTQKKSIMAFNADLNGAVYTKANSNWRDYADQQIRWMSKTSALKDNALWLVAIIVFLTNFLSVAWFGYSLYQVLTQSPHTFLTFIITLTLFNAKFIVDHLSLWMSFKKIKDKQSWSLSTISWPVQIMASLLYPFWTSGLLVVSFFYRPNWKGRKIRTK
jgi:glycosyltransferase involved in cell wall biosynthesis